MLMHFLAKSDTLSTLCSFDVIQDAMVESVKVVRNWIFCGTYLYGATKMCPAHIHYARRHVQPGNGTVEPSYNR